MFVGCGVLVVDLSKQDSFACMCVGRGPLAVSQPHCLGFTCIEFQGGALCWYVTEAIIAATAGICGHLDLTAVGIVVSLTVASADQIIPRLVLSKTKRQTYQ